jgi:hypothetical protein
MEGNLPPRILGLVIEWAGMHKEELLEDWELLESGGTYKRITPLI